MKLTVEAPRILTLDVECKPGHWIGGDYVSKILTAVAWQWDGEEKTVCLTHYGYDPGTLAARLAWEIRKADVVTGHYIRGFDLPLISGQLLVAGLPSLPPVWTLDTKLDLKKAHGRSLSQKNLSALLGIDAPKIDVTLAEWEAFNSKVDGAEARGIERVTGDVQQHREMRYKLVSLGWLGSGRLWTPDAGRNSRYHG